MVMWNSPNLRFSFPYCTITSTDYVLPCTRNELRQPPCTTHQKADIDEEQNESRISTGCFPINQECYLEKETKYHGRIILEQRQAF